MHVMEDLTEVENPLHKACSGWSFMNTVYKYLYTMLKMAGGWWEELVKTPILVVKHTLEHVLPVPVAIIARVARSTVLGIHDKYQLWSQDVF